MVIASICNYATQVTTVYRNNETARDCANYAMMVIGLFSTAGTLGGSLISACSPKGFSVMTGLKGGKYGGLFGTALSAYFIYKFVSEYKNAH